MPWLRIAMLCLAASTATAARPSATHDAVVRRFLALRAHMLGEQGSASDVDALLSLFAPDGRYEHPAAHVSMSLADARRGMLDHLREGTGVRIVVQRVLVGDAFAAAEVRLTYRMTSKSAPMAIDRSSVALFEFRGDLLTRVAEC
jgi:SnoaL-like domain